MGGTLQTPNGTHNAYITMVTGDRFVEPLSNLQVLTQSAALNDNEALPSSGGYQTLLDANLMTCQVKILEVVKAYLDAAVGMWILYLGIIAVNEISLTSDTSNQN